MTDIAAIVGQLEQGQGASAEADRATHEPSQQAVSAVPVGIPSAWRCFHCDDVFDTREAAAEHFGEGNYESEMPL